MYLRLVITTVLLISVGVFFYSLTLPYYSNQQEYNKLLYSWSEIGKAKYYEKEAVLRTNKVRLMDAGSGVAVGSMIVLVFLFSANLKHLSDLRKLQSFSKLGLIISANVIWLLMLPGTWWYYAIRLSRGDYPPFADSVGIPITAQFSTFLFFLIPLNIFLLLISIGVRLPAYIFSVHKKYYPINIVWEMIFTVLLLLNTVTLLSFVVDGDHFAILVFLFFTYILLSLRAGRFNNA